MFKHRAVPAVAAVVAGAASAFQSRINGQLSSELGNGLEAAVVSFTTGLIVVALVVVLVPSFRGAVRNLPAALRSGELKRWELIGGLFGAFFVAVQSATVPLVGVAVFTVAVVAGQSGNSLFVDKAGLGPAGRQPITARRVISALLAIAAVAIAVSNRFSDGHVAVLPVLFALLAGVGVAVQQAINGRVALEARSPVPATAVNFSVGTLALYVGLFVSLTFTSSEAGPLPGGPIWLYSGGVVGIVFIGIAAWVVPILGVLEFALLSIAGQLGGAVVLDAVAPTSGTELGWNLLVGVLLAFVAVAIGARRRDGGRAGSVRESDA